MACHRRKADLAEWNDVYVTGPGAAFIRSAYNDPGLIGAVTGMTLESQRRLVLRALDEGRDADRFADGVRAQAAR